MNESIFIPLELFRRKIEEGFTKVSFVDLVFKNGKKEKRSLIINDAFVFYGHEELSGEVSLVVYTKRDLIEYLVDELPIEIKAEDRKNLSDCLGGFLLKKETAPELIRKYI